MSSLVDQVARERATQEIHTAFALTAGAGSGKTAVLVQRLVQHLLSGVEPRQLAAITFTEKAALELRMRARDALEARRLQAADPAEQARLEALLGRFGDLTLSTIHSFCQDLLREEALEAGWAPDTALLDTAGGVAGCYDTWRRGLEQRHPHVALALREGFIPEVSAGAFPSPSLNGAASALLESRDLAPRVAPLMEVDWAADAARIRDLASSLRAASRLCLSPITCKLIALVQGLQGEVDSALALPDEEAAIRAFWALGIPKVGRAGVKKDWPSGALEACRAAVDNLRAAQEETQRTWHEQLHRTIVLDMHEHLIPATLQQRRIEAKADFADLLFRARAVLAEHPEVAARLAARWTVLLIDEVQDTDPVQAEIAARLTCALTGERWEEGAPRPGSLFAVGDPVQSIYRFRRADVDLWGTLQTLIARQGERLTLQQNFRSVPGLVGWVNHVFSDYPGYTPQAATRAPAALDPVVVVHPSPGLSEAEALLRHLQDLRARDAQVWDAGQGRLRPLRCGDVMVLLPSWSKADALQDALTEAGVQATVEGGRSFFERDELRLMLAAMRAIEEPLDATSLVFVLRGLFGLSHQALAEFKRDGGRWSYLMQEQPPGAVAEALRVLGRLHSLRSQRSWVRLLDELLDHTRASAVWALTARRWSVLANLDKLRALIYDLEVGARSPAEVIEGLEAHPGDEDMSVLDADLDAVRITTYFKAKGLEAPVVVLLHAERRLVAPFSIIHRDHGEIGVQLGGGVNPPGWAEAAEAEKAALSAERRRWMYVAATRARDQLVLIPSPQQPGGKPSGLGLFELDLSRGMGPFADADHDALHPVASGVAVRLRQAARLHPAAQLNATFPGLDEAVDALLEAPPLQGDPEGEAREQAWLRSLRQAAQTSTRWRSVGSLTRRRALSFEAGGVGAAGGTLVHRVMEHLDLQEPDAALRAQVPGLVRRFAAKADLGPELAARCEAVLLGILQHDVIRQARAAAERWREVPFAYPEGARVVAGTIDLCFPLDPERARWMVVDWKSHLPLPGSDLRAVYDRQLAYYARAVLATVTPCTHVTTCLVGPHPGLEEPPTPDDLLGLIHPDLEELVVELTAHAGLPVPGLELDLPGGGYAELELAWEGPRVALTLDLPEDVLTALRALGWQIVAADTAAASWPLQAREALLPLLLPAPAEVTP